MSGEQTAAIRPHATTNPLPVRCYRYARTCVHLLAGVATTMLVFPLVNDTRRRWLVKRWSKRLLRILRVEARVDGELVRRRQRAGRRQSHFLARHLRAQRASSGALRREGRARQVAGGVADDPRCGHGVHPARAPARYASRERSGGARAGAVATWSRCFPKARRPTAPRLLPFKSSLLQPIIEAQGHVQPVAIRYCTPDGEQSRCARLCRRHHVRCSRSGVCAGRARSRSSCSRGAALPATDASIGANSPSGGSRYPNGFGCHR